MSVTIKLNKLFEFHSVPKEGEHCVYCLFNDLGECVYVGQSGNLPERIYSHFKDGKGFTSFTFDVCDQPMACELEARKIVEMNPLLNKVLPKNESYISTVSARNNILKLLVDNEDRLNIVFTGHKFSKAKKKKYITKDDYNSIISNISKFFN